MDKGSIVIPHAYCLKTDLWVMTLLTVYCFLQKLVCTRIDMVLCKTYDDGGVIIMASVATINAFIQEQLIARNQNRTTAIEAAGWLDDAGLLADSRIKQGKPLRDLLRQGLVLGQKQESNNRWFIERVRND